MTQPTIEADVAPRLSVTEYAVLGVLADQPSHGFAISKVLGSEGDLGRVFTVRRSLIYRAIDRLVELGYVEPVATEPGTAGPKRVIRRITSSGTRRLSDWLDEPVEHLRDLRIEFLLKLAFLQRDGRPLIDMIRVQRAVLDPTIAALVEADTDDSVELWRKHNAEAASAYLADLESRYG